MDLFGKSVGDLQDGVVVASAIRPGRITGTSKYIADYTAAGFDMDRGHNFLALHADADAGATITVKAIGEAGDEAKALDSDGIIVLQLREGITAYEFTATKSGVTESKTFLLGLEKEPE